jgi:hypothetical protein
LLALSIYKATDFYYLTGFNEPDATVVLGEFEAYHVDKPS